MKTVRYQLGGYRKSIATITKLLTDDRNKQQKHDTTQRQHPDGTTS